MNATIKLIAAATTMLMLHAGAAFAQEKPEKTEVTIGLPVTTSTFLPLYLADSEGFFKEEGLDVQLTAFRGGTDMVRGMIAGAVDMGVTALAGVTLGIKAGQPLKVFYGGFNMAIFDWYAIQKITSIEDAKGARFGVTRIGSSTDFLTRYALKTKGLDPKTDVKIIQGGGSASRLAAMAADQIDVNIFAPPETFIAKDAGYNLILKQTDIAPDYPFHVFFATEDYIEKNPNTIKAVLRAFVKGVRLAKADKQRSVKELMDRVGMEEKYASRTYDQIIGQIYEDGRLPSDKGMQTFWGIGIESGQFKEAWDKDSYLLPTFVDSYEQWKPAQ
jgi:NitT/TauT family transport system substrate-binding protein